MKTVIIFDQCGDAAVKFLVVNGDLSHLNGVYINAATVDRKKEDELLHVIYRYNDAGEYIDAVPTLDAFPVQEVKDGASVIVCGFIP